MKKTLVLLGLLTTMFIGTQSFAACPCQRAYSSPMVAPCCQTALPCCPAKACPAPCCQTAMPCPACPIAAPCCNSCNSCNSCCNNNCGCGCGCNNCCRKKCSWWKFWENKCCCDKCDSCCDDCCN